MITEQEHDKLVEYVKDFLISGYEETHGDVKVVRSEDIRNMKLSYTSYKESQKGKRVKKPVEGKYIEEWNKFWNIWPNTKSVPGTQYISGAKMKGAEQKMYEKWLAVILDGERHDVHIANMYRAADCYLQWCYEDSKRLGRNEIQYRNGMEPWFNQQLYRTYFTVPYPVVNKAKVDQYTEA